MITEMIAETLKTSINKTIRFTKLNSYYYEGELLGIDSEVLKYNDRKIGIVFCPLKDIKEVLSIK